MPTEMTEAQIERAWRDAGLPEWFLGNGGSNHKLYAFAAAVRGTLRVDIDAEAANLDGMSEASRRRAFVLAAQGKEVRSAYERGRARGLQLAAHNLHLAPAMPISDTGRAALAKDGEGR